MKPLHLALSEHCQKPSKGFTLLEILIAMTIFFAAATSGLLAYQNAMSSSQKAEQVIRLLTYLESVQQQITLQLQQQNTQLFPQQGEGVFLDVNYSWQATLLQSGAPPADYDAETGEVLSYKPRFSLVHIELLLQSGSTQRVFHYQELLWLPVAELQQASP
jgi:type II secretory pathway pseudopilin PulG